MAETNLYKLNLWIPAGHTHVVTVNNRQTCDIPSFHTHGFAEMTVLASGRARHYSNEEQQEIEPGQILFIQPEHRHALQPLCDNTLIYNLMLLPAILHDLAHRFYNGQLSFWASLEKPRLQLLQNGVLHKVIRLLEQLSNEPGTRFYLEKCLLNLLPIMDMQPETLTVPQPPGWLKQSIDAFQENDNLDMLSNLDSFFKRCGRTPNHVARLCRQFYDCTPGQILQHYRVEKAARLLLQTDEDIINIAYKSGYRDLSHFYRQFKKQFGTTPHKYRQYI